MNTSSQFVINASLVSAAGTIVFFLALLLRRWFLERQDKAKKAILGAITRSYVKRVGGYADEERDERWPDSVKLEAVSHVHMLLRGGERTRLMQMAELDGLLTETLKRSTSWQASKRIDAIRLLQQFGSEACIARLRQLLVRDPNEMVRLEAAFALASMRALPPPRELIRILGMFDRPPNRLDSALMRETARDYADQLQMILQDPISPERKALIVDALGWSEDLSVLPALRSAAQSEYAELRSAALRAAAKLGHSEVADWAVPLLKDSEPFVRVQAVNCCAAIGIRSAIPELEALLEDEQLWVRMRTQEALERLTDNLPVSGEHYSEAG